ncbi:MAG: YbaK/EbsC family protein [Myxococcales bacterium]|nr:YbaK/EbsC family protein [Myxococcales bacterium]
MTPTDRLTTWFDAECAPFIRVDVQGGLGPAEGGAAIAAKLGAVGVKALLTKGDDGRFRILAIPARLELDSLGARQALGLRKLRFARPEELDALTGIAPGGVPPFGRPHFEADLIADRSLASASRVAFGGGHPLVRLSLSGDDWRRIAQPRFEALAGVSRDAT